MQNAQSKTIFENAPKWDQANILITNARFSLELFSLRLYNEKTKAEQGEDAK